MICLWWSGCSDGRNVKTMIAVCCSLTYPPSSIKSTDLEAGSNLLWTREIPLRTEYLSLAFQSALPIVLCGVSTVDVSWPPKRCLRIKHVLLGLLLSI